MSATLRERGPFGPFPTTREIRQHDVEALSNDALGEALVAYHDSASMITFWCATEARRRLRLVAQIGPRS